MNWKNNTPTFVLLIIISMGTAPCALAGSIGSASALLAQEQGGRVITATTPETTRKESRATASNSAAKARAERERLAREAEENLARERAARERAERETARERATREAAEAKLKRLETLSPSARIDNVWTETIEQNADSGLQIHVKFHMNNSQDVSSQAAAYFYDDNEKPLRDLNNVYKSADGVVSVGVDFKPSYAKSSFHDLKLFIPYKELHIVGPAKLKFFVSLYSAGKSLAASDWVEFSVPGSQLAEAISIAAAPSGKIEALSVEHNAQFAGNLGVMIHFNLTLDKLQGTQCRAAAFFYYANEQPIKATGHYATDTGTLVSFVDFTPPLVSAYYQDFKLFLPYTAMVLPVGEHQLKLFVGIYNKDLGYFVKSDWVAFTANTK